MLKKTTLLAALLIGAFSGGDAIAGEGDGKKKPGKGRMAELLKRYDLNGNGKIDPEERKKIAADRKKGAGKTDKPKTDKPKTDKPKTDKPRGPKAPRPPKTGGGEPGKKGPSKSGGGKKKGGGN